jgi:DNA-binding transcriptional regulator GbsR (MarR family)
MSRFDTLRGEIDRNYSLISFVNSKIDELKNRPDMTPELEAELAELTDKLKAVNDSLYQAYVAEEAE